MKKIIALLLAVLTVFTLASCNKKDKNGDGSDGDGNNGIFSFEVATQNLKNAGLNSQSGFAKESAKSMLNSGFDALFSDWGVGTSKDTVAESCGQSIADDCEKMINENKDGISVEVKNAGAYEDLRYFVYVFELETAQDAKYVTLLFLALEGNLCCKIKDNIAIIADAQDIVDYAVNGSGELNGEYDVYKIKRKLESDSYEVSSLGYDSTTIDMLIQSLQTQFEITFEGALYDYIMAFKSDDDAEISARSIVVYDFELEKDALALLTAVNSSSDGLINGQIIEQSGSLVILYSSIEAKADLLK